MKELIDIDGIGPILLTSRSSIKRLSIKLRPFKGVEVTFPLGTRPKSVMDFVNSHRQWIINAQQKIQEKEDALTVFDENTCFNTRSFALRIEPHQNPKVRIQFAKGLLHIHYPQNMDVKTASIQEVIRHGIEEALRRSAKSYLPTRLKELADLHGFTFKRVFIKNLKSRWGSCSGVDNVNLNLHLMRLPDELIDYVLLHELCHTIQKNHGPNFYKLMNKVMDNRVGALEREIKKHRTVIY